MKDLAIFSLELIFLILASLEKSWQSIYSCICFALVIVNLEMILKEFLSPENLFGAQTLYIYETIKVIVVRKDKNLMLATFQIVTPRLESLNNSQKLAVIGLIPSLCRNFFPRKEGYWIPIAQISLSDYLIWPSSGSYLA